MQVEGDRELQLKAGDSVARFSSFGAQCRGWTVAGRDMLWPGDEAIWPEVAPVLFPVCGWSRGGAIRIGAENYLMPVHGFASRATFAAERLSASEIVFSLAAGPTTRKSYPFDFEFSVRYRLSPDRLAAALCVYNAGPGAMPYACGLHPGFVWRPDMEASRFDFERHERPAVPVIAPGGLFSRETRPIPLRGRRLDLSRDLFDAEALCLLEVASRRFALVVPDGRLDIETEDFPHLVLWGRRPGDFLAVESWTGTGDPVGFDGDLFERPSMIHLAPGERRVHRVSWRWTGGRESA